jgi:TatD DNase family protein
VFSFTDYDRLHLSDKESQLKAFPPQLELANQFSLPLFLHCRTSEAHRDFVDLVRKRPPKVGGVVHSFTGTLDEAKEFIDLGFSIGINGLIALNVNSLLPITTD